jgi:hypothetical protein
MSTATVRGRTSRGSSEVDAIGDPRLTGEIARTGSDQLGTLRRRVTCVHTLLTVVIPFFYLAAASSGVSSVFMNNGIILDLTGCGQRLNNRAAILQSKIT